MMIILITMPFFYTDDLYKKKQVVGRLYKTQTNSSVAVLL